MNKVELGDAIREGSVQVLETMFFAETAESVPARHEEPVACTLQCSGTQTGSFSIAVDCEALKLLCESFYGESGDSTAIQEIDLICELTNMLAGATLSRFSPLGLCALSSPVLCDVARHLEIGTPTYAGDEHSQIYISLEGGLLSASCTLRKNV
jgi:CheY-specific phosphatase CheX